MKKLPFVCALALTVAAASAGAATNIPLLHRHHKDTGTEAPKPKAKSKKTFLHRTAPSREQAARSEATFGMTGPKSVGWRHPQPGPAGFGGN